MRYDYYSTMTPVLTCNYELPAVSLFSVRSLYFLPFLCFILFLSTSCFCSSSSTIDGWKLLMEAADFN